MVINQNKFTKLQRKLEKKLIGEYGSNKGLGNDLVIKKYEYTRNEDGEKTYGAVVSTQTVKGIVVRDLTSEIRTARSIRATEQEIRLYVSMDVEVEDSEPSDSDSPLYVYLFEFAGSTWKLNTVSPIGQVTNLPGVIKEIRLAPFLGNV